MVIPVCFKCESPVEIISIPEDGVEYIIYQCPQCNNNSATFLLGYIEDSDKPQQESAPAKKYVQRDKFFDKAPRKYKLRAKMQRLMKLRKDTDQRSNRANRPAGTE